MKVANLVKFKTNRSIIL